MLRPCTYHKRRLPFSIDIYSLCPNQTPLASITEMVEFHGNNNQVEGHSGGFWHHVQINEFNQRVGIVRLCCKVLPREYGCMWGTTNLSPSMENICGWGIKHLRIKHHGNVGVTRGYKDGAFFAVGISGIKQWGRIRSIASRVLSQSQRQESWKWGCAQTHDWWLANFKEILRQEMRECQSIWRQHGYCKQSLRR